MPKPTKGYITKQNKFFEDRSQAVASESVSALKAVATEIARQVGVRADHIEIIVVALINAAPEVAPALRAAVPFVKANRKATTETATARNDAYTAHSDASHALERFVKAHLA